VLCGRRDEEWEVLRSRALLLFISRWPSPERESCPASSNRRRDSPKCGFRAGAWLAWMPDPGFHVDCCCRLNNKPAVCGQGDPKRVAPWRSCDKPSRGDGNKPTRNRSSMPEGLRSSRVPRSGIGIKLCLSARAGNASPETGDWERVEGCDVPTPAECISLGMPCQGPLVATEVASSWRPWALMGAVPGPEARRRVRNAHLPWSSAASRWADLLFDHLFVSASSCGASGGFDQVMAERITFAPESQKKHSQGPISFCHCAHVTQQLVFRSGTRAPPSGSLLRTAANDDMDNIHD
jgi:hypothetical protein